MLDYLAARSIGIADTSTVTVHTVSYTHLEAHPGPVRGKYFKDTAIFNIFPPELSERGEFLGQILPEGLSLIHIWCKSLHLLALTINSLL